jgi:hypothetical protein
LSFDAPFPFVPYTRGHRSLVLFNNNIRNYELITVHFRTTILRSAPMIGCPVTFDQSTQGNSELVVLRSAPMIGCPVPFDQSTQRNSEFAVSQSPFSLGSDVQTHGCFVPFDTKIRMRKSILTVIKGYLSPNMQRHGCLVPFVQITKLQIINTTTEAERQQQKW